MLMKSRMSLGGQLLSCSAKAAVAMGLSFLGGTLPASANDFYVQLNPNYFNGGSEQLFIFGTAGSTGAIQGEGYAENFTLGDEGYAVITLPKSFVLSSGAVENKGLKVSSGSDISGYFLSRQQYTTDMTYLIDSRSLGTDYFTLGYAGALNDQISVQATEDNTTVTISPSDGTGAFQISLNAGQTYMHTSGSNLTGSRVTADRPVSVFSGNECANVPMGASACDHLVEQMPSVEMYSSDYVVAQSPRTGSYGNVYRVVASQDGTEVRLDGALLTTLDAGQYVETSLAGGARITSSQPVLVGQYLIGESLAGEVTDPALAVVPGVEDWLDSYVFATPAGSADFVSDFATIVMTAGSVDTLTIDGETPDLTLFTPIGSSGFSYASYDVSGLLGPITISAAERFLLMIYGFSEYDSYATYGGASYSPGASGGGDFDNGDTPDIDGIYTTAQLAASQVNPVFAGGTLVASSADIVANDFAVESLGGTIDTAGQDVTFSGDFTGPGGLAKAGLGTLSLTGASLLGGDVLVNDGTLLILGSFQAPAFRVFAGGTLGGSGDTLGDVIVGDGGTILGGMNISGDVTLGSGSLSIFGDAISVDGTVTIEDGASAQVQAAPGLPGSVRTLVTTTGGLAGAYSTVTLDAGVWGALRQTASSLELVSLFGMRQAANPQAVLTASHLNSLFVAGAATPAILAAVPGLVDGEGYGNAAALGTLHPEAYGSIAQLGHENALAIRSAIRSGNFAAIGEEPGMFTFVQGLGQWRRLEGDRVTGVSRSTLESRGVMGGLGFNNGSFMINAFIGSIDGSQQIAAIGADTDTDGTFFGTSVQYASGPLVAGGALIVDHSSARTSRSLFNGATVRDRYSLRSTTFDGYVRYGMAVAESGWRLGPQLGLTHVITSRGDVAEAGDAAFALSLAKEDYKATFLTGDLVMTNDSIRARPWLSAGISHRISGDAIRATASFDGTPTGFTVLGVEREKTFATLSGGMDYQLTGAVSLYLQGGAELRSGYGAEHVTGGVRVRF